MGKIVDIIEINSIAMYTPVIKRLEYNFCYLWRFESLITDVTYFCFIGLIRIWISLYAYGPHIAMFMKNDKTYCLPYNFLPIGIIFVRNFSFYSSVSNSYIYSLLDENFPNILGSIRW